MTADDPLATINPVAATFVFVIYFLMQCPNCSFYKVEILRVGETYKIPEKSIGVLGWIGSLITIVIITVIVWAVGGVVVMIGLPIVDFFLTSKSADHTKNILAVWSVLCLLSSIIFLARLIYEDTHRGFIKGGGVGDYECKHCGYTWSN